VLKRTLESLCAGFAFVVAVSGQPKIVSVVNSASFQSGLPAGGALATVFVSGVTGLQPGTYLAPLAQPLPHTLGGVSVAINDDYAALLAVIVPADLSANIQINFQVPLSANASESYNYFDSGGPVYAGYIAVGGAVQSVGGVAPQWGGFFAQANGFAVALHADDSSLVTQQSPARPGESIIVFGDDFFMTWPPPPIGLPAPQGIAFQVDYTWVHHPSNLYLQTYPTPITTCAPGPGPCAGSVTNTPALKITSMGLLAGSIGVEQIEFVVPLNQQPGNWALFFNLGSCPDGSGIPGTCGATTGISSPYVLLPVGQ